MTARFRTVLVEDDRLLRLLNRTLLEQSGRFDVVAEADDGERALMQVARHQPDCVILDLVMPNTDGFQAIPKIRMANPKSCIVVVSMLPQRGTEEEVVRLGASCFIDKAEDSERFVRLSIEAVERWQSKMRRTGRALAPSP